jgi:hypothetical protein
VRLGVKRAVLLPRCECSLEANSSLQAAGWLQEIDQAIALTEGCQAQHDEGSACHGEVLIRCGDVREAEGGDERPC